MRIIANALVFIMLFYFSFIYYSQSFSFKLFLQLHQIRNRIDTAKVVEREELVI